MTDFKTILFEQKQELELTDCSLFVSRKEEQLIDLHSSLAQIVIGVRRSGKSTLCKKVLLQSKVQYAYVNFDDERFLQLEPNDLNEILSCLYQVYGQFTHLFMDEVQNVQGWHLFVNRLLRQGLHILLTGSNANLLSTELSTHLTGRYNQIELFPFSVAEVCQYKKLKTAAHTTQDKALLFKEINDYLSHGGFPEILQNGYGANYISSLLHAIVYKDISHRYNIYNTRTLWQMANLLLDLFCQELSFNELARQFEMSVHTVKKYVGYFNDAYLLRILPRYTAKPIQRLSAGKAYVIDPALIVDRTDVVMTENLGWKLENVVCIELLRRINPEVESLCYIKQNNFEVDFAVVTRGRVSQLVQVTYDFTQPKTKLYNREVGGLVKAAKLTNCHNLTLLSMHCTPSTIEKDNEQIHLMSIAEWLLGQ